MLGTGHDDGLLGAEKAADHRVDQLHGIAQLAAPPGIFVARGCRTEVPGMIPVVGGGRLVRGRPAQFLVRHPRRGEPGERATWVTRIRLSVQ